MALTKVSSDMVDFAVGGGGKIPETEIFTSSAVWSVPQSVQDEIAAEGHAEIGLFMVGGGTSSNSGEIVNELFPLTTADYDPITVTIDGTGASSGDTSVGVVALTKDLVGGTFSNNSLTHTISAGAPSDTSITFTPALNASITASSTISVTHPGQSNPNISVTVGAVGGDTGITSSGGDSAIEEEGVSIAQINNGGSANFGIDHSPELGPNGYPLVSELVLRVRTHRTSFGVPTDVGQTVTDSNVAYFPSASGFTSAPNTLTIQVDNSDLANKSDAFLILTIGWNTPTEFDGTITSALYYRDRSLGINSGFNGGSISVTWNQTNNVFNISDSGGTVVSLVFSGSNISYERLVPAVRKARNGGFANVAQFRNNPQSTEGYFGGFARFNGQTEGSGGSSPQGGYVQILYT